MSVEIVDNVVSGTVDDLATFTGISARRVQQLEKSRVMLRMARGRYDLQSSCAAYCGYLRGTDNTKARESEANERARLLSSKADLAALEYDERSGVLIDAEQVRKQDFAQGLILRRNLQSLPDRIAALVAAESDQGACHRLIAIEVDRTLNEIIEAMQATDADPEALDITRREAATALDDLPADPAVSESADEAAD